MNKSRTQDIKKEQKKSVYFREVSLLLRELALDEQILNQVFVSRIELSADGGICYIYLSSHTDPQLVDQAIGTLILYKASLRKGLAQKIKSRYTPDLAFRYDEELEKEQRLQSLLDSIKGSDGESNS